ncbi:Ras-related protein, putative [Trichomonas vaginalis G3]|uniref:Ras-related protein, putative n=1 Tax=Trichomonas vaginalis (strain ATCC PRA-98 / G3) TaxID=412133 RepID=A2EFD0_TRIV3|nr:GTPase protein [Trichomonas vaginalis G3]EAY08627.1 Ras-related protein, putative [Trichomonas vaginalis G3]KAI5536741.1 GTPase protein [Trichomonas vaginalis G3]|eukprot:XP_001320850.1 Ras-related protein [Trichomonas vaginalis G3]
MNNPKVILCGNSGVGKTTLMHAISSQKISRTEGPTMGSGFTNCNLQYGTEMLSVNFWDTAGQETYRSMIRIYFHNSHLALLVFDLQSKETFDELDSWIKLPLK